MAEGPVRKPELRVELVEVVGLLPGGIAGRNAGSKLPWALFLTSVPQDGRHVERSGKKPHRPNGGGAAKHSPNTVQTQQTHLACSNTDQNPCV